MVEQKKLVKPIELTLVTPAGEAYQVLMKHSPFAIGRHESCDMVLNSRSVSRLHCQLKLKSFGLTVKDLESRNGTYVDDVQIVPKERIALTDGSVLRIGKFRLRVDRIHHEVEIAEEGAWLFDAQTEPANESPSKGTEEPDALLAQLEQFIVHAHKKRQPREKRPEGIAALVELGDAMAATNSSALDSKASTSSSAPEDTVLNKPHETKLSGPSSHGQTLYESEVVEPTKMSYSD